MAAPQHPQRPAEAPRRNRHAHAHRGPLAWPPAPRMRSRRDTFDEYVLAAIDACEHEWKIALEGIDIGVEDVPPTEPTAWEESIVLGRGFPGNATHPPRLVMYRLPITTRAKDPREQMMLVHHVVRTQLAELVGIDLDEDPR